MDKRPLLLTLLQTIDRLRPYFITRFIAGHNIGQSNGIGQTQNLRLYHFVVWKPQKTSREKNIFPFNIFCNCHLFHILEDIKLITGFVLAVASKFQTVNESRRDLVIIMLPLDWKWLPLMTYSHEKESSPFYSVAVSELGNLKASWYIIIEIFVE